MRFLSRQVGMTRRRMRDAAGLPARVAAQAPRVTVVIAARNNGPYLKEAIQSACDQTVPCEVIYSDDASTDDSVRVAESFADKGVLILRAQRHSGVCAARNRAVLASTGTHLVHLDGDDILTPTFVADHLSAMAPGVPFVYGPAQAFGTLNTLWEVPRSWGETDLWAGNSCNTSSMYARWAFDAAGGWQDGVGTMWDWDLALRAARLGNPSPSRALLMYRQHPESWSHQIREKGVPVRSLLQSRVRELRARVSVGCVLGGRLGAAGFRDWIAKVTFALHQMRLAEKPEIAILCTGRIHAAAVARLLAPYEDQFRLVKLVDQRFRLGEPANEDERRARVSQFMAGSHNALRELMSGDLHWIIEDDILVPSQSGRLLQEQLVSGGGFPPHAATGVYRNRHLPDELVLGFRVGDRHDHLHKPPQEPAPVDFSGTGCLMFWKDRTPRMWKPKFRGVPAHDWAWCADLKESNGKLIAVPDARCGHVRGPDDILW